MGMFCYEFNDVTAFYEKVAPVMLKDEVVNNLSFGIINALKSQSKDVNFKKTPFLAYVGEEDQPKLILVMTPPNNLVLNGPEENSERLISLAVDYLLQNNIEIPGIIGTVKLVEAFKKAYLGKTGFKSELEMSQRIYKLEKVNPIHKSSGFLREATEADIEIITGWILVFDQEAMNGEMTEAYARERAERGVNFKTIYMWEDEGHAVSMANKGRSTLNGVIVNLVYTPVEHRGKGYATSCVAEVSQKILGEGKAFCSLYTDLANPTSNSIYMKIGYQPVADSLVYRFIK
jgi:uncharacterized protein